MLDHEKFTADMLACRACRLCETRTQVVPGDGDPQSPIFFIGEAPGKNEDKKGIPFCGAAGKFLAEMLAENNFTRDAINSDPVETPRRGISTVENALIRIFITNIVKCRPPENRDPEPDEKEICSRLWLAKQIEFAHPKIIVTLGRHSMNYFLPDAKISDAHGKVFRLENGQVIIPLYHPAAALYNGSQRATHKKDFQVIRKTLEEIIAEKK